MLKRLGPLPRFLLGLAGILTALAVTAALWLWLPAWPRLAWTLPDLPTDFMLSPDGQTLALGHPFGISLWDTNTGEQKAMLSLAAGPGVMRRGVGLEALSANGQVVVYHDEGGSFLRLWDAAAGQETVTMRNSPTAVTASADGRILAIHRFPGWAIADDQPLLWDLTTGKPRRSPLLDTRSIFQYVALRDGRLLGVEQPGDESRTVWDLRGDSRLLTFAESDRVLCSADGGRCVNGRAGTVEVWDLASGHLLGATPGDPPFSAADLHSLSPDGRLLLTWRKWDQNSCILWDISSFPPRRLGILSETGGRSMGHFSPDGRWLAVCLPSDFAERWDIWQTEPLGRRLRLANANLGVTFAPDSQTAASTSLSASEPSYLDRLLNRNHWVGNDVTVWNLPTAEALATFRDCVGFAYLPDSKHLAIARANSTVEVWPIVPRRPGWVEYGLPVVFALLVLLGVRLVWLAFRRPRAEAGQC